MTTHRAMKRSRKRTDPFYSDRSWHKLRSKVKSQWKRSGRPCGICGKPLDWHAKPIVDHIQPRTTHPHLAHDIENLQVVHHACNTRKSAWHENSNKPMIGPDGYPIDSE